jgi:hypothetical protein
MVTTCSEARRQLNRVVDFFFFACISGILISTLQTNWWLAFVWLAAAFLDGMIGLPEVRNAMSGSMRKDQEIVNALADEQEFAHKFLKFNSLLAATALATGFALGNPWWSNMLVAAVA